MNARDEINNELKAIGLHTLAKHTPVADSGVDSLVFDQLGSQIMDKISTGKPDAKPQIRIIQISARRALAYAASLLLIIATAVIYYLMENRTEPMLAEDIQLEDYFLNIADTDRGMFYDLIHSNGVQDYPHDVLPAQYQQHSDYILEYLLDVAQIQGIEPEEFIFQTTNFNQPE